MVTCVTETALGGTKLHEFPNVLVPRNAVLTVKKTITLQTSGHGNLVCGSCCLYVKSVVHAPYFLAKVNRTTPTGGVDICS